MKWISYIGLLVLILLFGCDKVSYNTDIQHTAQIAGFDLNCSTCIVMFPDDSLQIKREIGGSPNNFYQVVNLDRGSFKVGQKLKLKVRKAKDTELRACITLYPSSKYENIYMLESEKYKDLTLNDTIDLTYKDCIYDSEFQTYICFDSVLTDSRCPNGVVCVWAGNAAARFKFDKLNTNPFFSDLYTHTGTIINGYEIYFLDLFPYPTLGIQIKPEDYKARIVIKRK